MPGAKISPRFNRTHPVPQSGIQRNWADLMRRSALTRQTTDYLCVLRSRLNAPDTQRLFRGGGAGGDPLVVGAVGGAAEPAGGADFLFGAGTGPFADFGVAIGEGEAARAVVEAGGEVAPSGVRI